MSIEVIAFAHQSLEEGAPVALAILTESGRDTPGVPGGMMAVRADGGRLGTVGGGAAEATIIQDCIKALEDADSTVISFDYSLKKEGGLGMICGGGIKGIITVLRPARRLIIFGGGHVGQKLYEAGLTAGFSVTVVEDRPEYAQRFPKAESVIAQDFGTAARSLSIHEESYIVIVTRGHAQDYAVLSAVIETNASYIGMIGSRSKVAGLIQKLRDQGVPQERIDALYTPVGLEIDNGTPGEIAIAVLAEIIAVKNNGRLRHCRDRAKDA